MIRDFFWPAFVIVIGIFFGAVGFSTARFFDIHLSTFFSNQATSSSLALIGPIAEISGLKTEPVITLPEHIFYRESLPYLYSSASWNTTINWRSQKNVFSGSYSAQIKFNTEWSGVHVASDRKGAINPDDAYKGLSLNIFLENDFPDLYISLYDENEHLLGMQSLFWYSGGIIQKGVWREVVVPLSNLGANGKKIRGVSIESPVSGVMYLDDVQLVNRAPTVAVWIPPQEEAESTSTESTALSLLSGHGPLPYEFTESDPTTSRLVPIRGNLYVSGNNLFVNGDPVRNENSGITVVGDGLSWKNYTTRVRFDWGSGQAFAIIARFKDDLNYVSCNFSNYGGAVEIHQATTTKIKASVNLIAESPELAVSDNEGWLNINLGASVEGDTLSCLLNNEVILRATIPGMPGTGTTGIETWSLYSDTSPYRIKSLTVTSLP